MKKGLPNAAAPRQWGVTKKKLPNGAGNNKKISHHVGYSLFCTLITCVFHSAVNLILQFGVILFSM